MRNKGNLSPPFQGSKEPLYEDLVACREEILRRAATSGKIS